MTRATAIMDQTVTAARTARPRRSERLLDALEPYRRVVLVSHVNPDPDALASMLGLQALIEQRQPGKTVALTVEGIIARAENQAMVDLLQIPLVPVADVPPGPDAAFIMVDSQPNTGRRASEAVMPVAVLDHHETPGHLDGVAFRDIRPNLGATSTMVTGYLLEQELAIDKRLATALLYGIETETSGYPREAGPADDGALVWLFPRADKDLLARIRHPRLPQSYFAVYLHALSNAFLYRDVVVSYLGQVPQPDIIAELADFFIRFDQVGWAMCLGLYDGQLKVSIRSDHIGGHGGEVLREVVDGLGSAGGHDKRAGGAIPISDPSPDAIEALLRTIRRRFLTRLNIDEQYGHRLLQASPVIPVP
jgi:nanoRNase/pAp phosphatase (c-di-AMP/oligoRNAs hydrolase)